MLLSWRIEVLRARHLVNGAPVFDEAPEERVMLRSLEEIREEVAFRCVEALAERSGVKAARVRARGVDEMGRFRAAVSATRDLARPCAQR